MRLRGKKTICCVSRTWNRRHSLNFSFPAHYRQYWGFRNVLSIKSLVMNSKGGQKWRALMTVEASDIFFDQRQMRCGLLQSRPTESTDQVTRYLRSNRLISNTAKTEACCLSFIIHKGPFNKSSLASWELISTMFLLLPLFLDWSWSLLAESGQILNHRQGGSPRNKSNVATLKDENFLSILWSESLMLFHTKYAICAIYSFSINDW